MATIKQIDGRTVHQIQSGQVIVDLCSVVKELVENSIDAGATSIDVRFKNQGLDLIEVADNGSGIAPANYPSVALKHHTSKLSSYSDIATLETFGFRGEALASLCALSIVSITTCQQGEAPKGTKLSFEPSGALKGTAVVAASKGTTVSVERLFHNLPVRRRELERNIKREWNKVIALLGQYACIQTNLKFSVSQQPTKGKRIHLFSTKGNPTTRENIINIFGAKTMTVLVPLDLTLEMHPSTGGPALQIDQKHKSSSRDVRVVGHVSRPSHGDGRQTPDRQMFFVNRRPCGLPQFAKAFNEVYKAYNSSQAPFILADIQLDTHMYDVNVSPDKRSILLHDQNQLLDNLRTSLTALFDSQDYSVPTSQLLPFKNRTEKQSTTNTPFKPLSITPQKPLDDSQPEVESDEDSDESSPVAKVPLGAVRRVGGSKSLEKNISSQHLISGWVERGSTSRPKDRGTTASTFAQNQSPSVRPSTRREEPSLFIGSPSLSSDSDENDAGKPLPVRDFNKQLKVNSVTKTGSSPTKKKSSELLENEPQIPATKPLRRGQGGSSHTSPTKTPREKATSEAATIVIGNEIIQDAASTPDRHANIVAVSEDEMEVDNPKPSFGSRLTQIYAAGSGATDRKISFRKEQAGEGSDGGEISDSEGTDTNTDSDTFNANKDGKAVSEPAIPVTGSDRPGKQTETNDLSDITPFTFAGEPATTDHKTQSLKSSVRKKESTVQLLQHLRTDESLIKLGLDSWRNSLSPSQDSTTVDDEVTDLAAANAEEKLSLTIARKDFLKMKIVGQFNMGFIIATRLASTGSEEDLEVAQKNELFIIDQHATDEKYNFERLQEIQTVQSQRLVHPKRLELTALEEEIVLQNISAIEANGFKVHVDMTGDEPVGSRCEVLALPMSREVTFSITDLEELIALLGEESSESKHIPRPSKVRKMFASRACRSSVMIGKALTHGQMETLVRHMAELDKPWNCPHGRPTMRHLCQLDSWDAKGWRDDNLQGPSVSWRAYLNGE
ncbi:Mismatch repair endonuclease PMS2 [Fusarium oxysporum f. sp. cubense race 1]|uniref:DNA mismatch repair protein PMS1 n=1 Tax=Fusarium oxysporum f. sp. cubense (strain race 1) TaxID=1229664 RepID=N4TZF7_FUSC1|nr:Mismatch repair endonuclease PMS2 [Fusarium oxysporum f. sp. cubense race 1]